MTHIDRVLIANNNFSNLDRRPGDKYDYSKGCIEVHNGSDAYIVNNTVTDGDIRVGPLGINEPPTTSTEWVVIDGNTLNNTRINAVAGSHHIMIRNNLLRVDKDQAIVISGADKAGRTNTDIAILNNTAINNSTAGAFIKLWGRGQGITMKNNLFVAASLQPGSNGTSAVNVADQSLISFIEISRNIWPSPTVFNKGTSDGVCIVGDPKSGGGYCNAAAWAQFPQVKADIFANLPVDGAGIPTTEGARGFPAVAGVFCDHDGHLRPASGITAGAFEIAPAPTTMPAVSPATNAAQGN